jgi:hypothetical protein
MIGTVQARTGCMKMNRSKKADLCVAVCKGDSPFRCLADSAGTTTFLTTTLSGPSYDDDTQLCHRAHPGWKKPEEDKTLVHARMRTRPCQ